MVTLELPLSPSDIVSGRMTLLRQNGACTKNPRNIFYAAIYSFCLVLSCLIRPSRICHQIINRTYSDSIRFIVALNNKIPPF